MKKKFLGTTFLAAIALMGAWSISQNNKNVNFSDLALYNIEALASSEGGGTVSCCPDPGDTCKLSSGDTLRDHDEC